MAAVQEKSPPPHPLPSRGSKYSAKPAATHQPAGVLADAHAFPASLGPTSVTKRVIDSSSYGAGKPAIRWR